MLTNFIEKGSLLEYTIAVFTTTVMSHDEYVAKRKPPETLREDKTEHDEVCGPL